MDRTPSKDQDSVSGLARQRSVQSQKKSPQQPSLIELMKSHSMIKTLTHQKIQMLRKFHEESQRGRTTKNLRITSKGFVDKVPPQFFQLLTEMTYREFALFLRNQKRTDDQKMRKLGRLITDWESQSNKADWKAPLNKFFEQEKTRYKKSYK